MKEKFNQIAETLLQVGVKSIQKFRPSSNHSGNTDTDKANDAEDTGQFTNQSLVNRLDEEFGAQIKRLSVDDIVLFPMSITILLHPEDYANLWPSFSYIIESIVKRLYANLSKAADNSKKIKAPATEWALSLAQSDAGSLCGLQIGKGNPGFIMALNAINIGDGALHASNNVVVSISCQNSKPSESININPEAIKGVNVLGGDQYRVKYNSSLQFDEDDIADSIVRATLRYTPDASTIYTFEMRDDIMFISGEDDDRPQSNIFKLTGVKDMEKGHVQIRYDRAEGRFFISTVAPDTRVAGKLLPQSVGGAAESVLPKHVQIFMMGRYAVDFDSVIK